MESASTASGAGSGDRESIGSEASDDKSINGDKVVIRENGDLAEEIRPKGSRRTTSLLNLFIPLSQGFLRSRREKKDKKSKKKDSVNPTTGKEDKSDDEKDGTSETPTCEIDDEGYTVRPKTTFENDKGGFYSSSESDSEEERDKRLRFEIKPSTNGTGGPLSASVDELRTTVENMTLSPIGISGRKLLLHDAEATMKRSQSVSQRIGSSSPPSRHQYTPLSPPAPTNHRTNSKPGVADSASRYSELADIFNEVGDIQPALPPKVSSYRNTPTPTSGLVAIPRPSSRPRPEGLLQRNLSSPSPAISRTESIGSLDTRSVGGSFVTGSRGPSPLTLGMSDSIPLAVAFHEIVHARFKGNEETMCQVKITGDMMLSFPAGILHVFATNPNPSQLSFQVRTLQRLDNLVWNKDLVQVQRDQDDLLVEFDMSALVGLLKRDSEQNPSASYFNVNIIKYHITPKSGAGSCPLQLVAFWKRDLSQVDLRIDYKCNSHALAPPTPTFPHKILSSKTELPPLNQVCIAAHVQAQVKNMQSKPTGQWFPSTGRACWKIPSISCAAANQGVGTLRARFDVSSLQGSVGAIAAQFSCENSTLSGNEFYLMGSGYRVSLIKKCFVSGKYTCDAEESSRSNAESAGR